MFPFKVDPIPEDMQNHVNSCCLWKYIRSHNCMLQAHMEVHGSDRPYTCGICGKGFKQVAQLKNHEHVHKEGMDPERAEGKW